MFKKILIANRGEIAVRIVRTCRELGVATVALYEAADRGSLHVRLADECVLLEAADGFMDQQAILDIAVQRGADAIHPGYGFLAERADFSRACDAAGITLIGAPTAVLERVGQKTEVLRRAQQAGFATPAYAELLLAPECASHDIELDALLEAAETIGYPLMVKSCRGGRGRGERLVWSAERLKRAAQRAQAESQAVYADRQIYLEKAIFPAHQVGVQVMGDAQGNLIHLGEREGSLLYGNQKIIEEAPAPCLKPAQREQLWQAALELARLFNYQNVGTVEFLVAEDGRFYFTEIKPRIQIEHPLTEMLARVDLVAEQIRLAAGEALTLKQEAVHLNGWVLLCRISAEDPWQRFLPSPGRVRQVRLPGGPDVRVDTYLYSGCEIPAQYDPLIAKLVIWGQDRAEAVRRMRAALQEFQLAGAANNLPLVQRILEQPGFLQGDYNTESLISQFSDTLDEDGTRDAHRNGVPRLADLAAVAAITYTYRDQVSRPTLPVRLLSGWHRESRRVPS